MQELDKGLGLAFKGPNAEEAVVRARKQIDEWGLSMPDVVPLVLDFGLGDFYQTGEVEFWIANETEAGYCGKLLFVFSEQTCPLHMHNEKTETFYVVKGSLRVVYDNKTLTLQAGDTLLVETGKYHSFTGLEPTLLLEVSKPSVIDDNYFSDTRIPIGGNYRRNQE